MSKDTAEEAKSKKPAKKRKTGYGGWLFRTKGTVAEPWPTGEELLNDPQVQKEIKKVRTAFKNYKAENS